MLRASAECLPCSHLRAVVKRNIDAVFLAESIGEKILLIDHYLCLGGESNFGEFNPCLGYSVPETLYEI